VSLDLNTDTAADAFSREQSNVSARQLIAIIFVITAIVAVLYVRTLVSLQAHWEDLDNLAYTHGYLIVAVCAYLLFRVFRGLADITVTSSAGALIAVTILSVLWLVMYQAGIELGHQMLLPLIAWLCIYAATGREVARRCAFTFSYFYFAIPVWSLGNELLQYLTVHAVRLMLAIGGFSAYVVDNFVHIPNGSFEIAGGCSGLHFFVVALAIAALYGELNRDSLKNRILLLALAAILAALSNWIRVFWIIAAGYLSEMQHSLIREGHYYFGWKVFAVTMIVFFVIARRFPIEPNRSIAAGSAQHMSRSLPVVVAASIAAAAVGPLWAAAVAPSPTTSAVQVVLPLRIAAWSAQSNLAAEWTPQFPGADGAQVRTYRDAGGAFIDAYAAVYGSQHQGKELHGYNNSIVGPSKMHVLAEQQLTTPVGSVNELKVQDSLGEQALIWYFYEVDGRRTTSGLMEQLLYGIRSLFSAPLSQVVALRTVCAADCGVARGRLAEFLSNLPPIRMYVGKRALHSGSSNDEG
jgi:EpsI family protein